MSIHKFLEDAVISELEGDENSPIPEVMFLEMELFDKLRSELVIANTSTKLPVECKSFTITFAGKPITIRSEDWEEQPQVH